MSSSPTHSTPTHSPSSSKHHKDVDWVFDTAHDVELHVVDPSAHLDRTVWWKMDLFILPVATLVFFLSFLVRRDYYLTHILI